MDCVNYNIKTRERTIRYITQMRFRSHSATASVFQNSLLFTCSTRLNQRSVGLCRIKYCLASRNENRHRSVLICVPTVASHYSTHLER